MRVIDLSQPIFQGMSVFPGDPEVEIQVSGSPAAATGLIRRISLGSHTGTHVDAFSHMHPQGTNLDDIPLERYFGPARVVRPGRSLPRGVGLIYLDAPAGEHLEEIAACGPPFVAGDLPPDLERALLGRDILTYTNLTNLEMLPEETEFTFYGLPLPIAGGDGSPVRAIAIIP